MRNSFIERRTNETDIKLTLHIDGSGKHEIDTGIGFFDHMLTAFAVHSGFDLQVSCKGDLKVDGHHTIEDVGIVLGCAFYEAMENKTGIARYGNFTIPMDEALASCSVDISGRPYLVFQGKFHGEAIGQMDTQMVEEFFRAVAFHGKFTLHLNVLYGTNDHHMCEALFKAAAHALAEAVKQKGQSVVLSSKGVIA